MYYKRDNFRQFKCQRLHSERGCIWYNYYTLSLLLLSICFAKLAYDDFQPIYNLDVEFDNEEIRRCIQINTTTDFLLEQVETFLVHFRYADTEMVLRVLILDNSTGKNLS